MENACLLKDYFLNYASCIYCSKLYRDSGKHSAEASRDIATNGIDSCTEHHHVFTNFFVEQHMIPIIMQQFLIDMGIKCEPKMIENRYSGDTAEERTIDFKDIELFWNDYVDTIPGDLELIWDTIDNGLVRYLQV